MLLASRSNILNHQGAVSLSHDFSNVAKKSGRSDFAQSTLQKIDVYKIRLDVANIELPAAWA
jgi:hypothetical protein